MKFEHLQTLNTLYRRKQHDTKPRESTIKHVLKSDPESRNTFSNWRSQVEKADGAKAYQGLAICWGLGGEGPEGPPWARRALGWGGGGAWARAVSARFHKHNEPANRRLQALWRQNRICIYRATGGKGCPIWATMV